LIDTLPWNCPTCHSEVATPYCPGCGERALGTQELTLRGLFDQVFLALTSIDGRLIRTFRALVSRPGQLTAAYLRGQRQPYIGPVSLFLLANVLFFAIESLTGGTVFSTPLHAHLHNQPWSGVAESLVSNRLQHLRTTLDIYAPQFDRAVARNARSFIILMALSFALVPRIMFPRSRWPFVAHAVFALHLYAFMLLLFCIATTVPVVNRFAGGPGIEAEHLDAGISLSLLVACAAYLYISVGPVYGGSAGSRFFKALGLTVGVAIIVLSYRFALLLVTLYST